MAEWLVHGMMVGDSFNETMPGFQPIVEQVRVSTLNSYYGFIDMVSTGPDREHTILLRHPYKA